MPRLLRKVIRIRAEDSPNVRAAFDDQAQGRQPDGRELIPGVLSWAEYTKRRATWDAVLQAVGLDAVFWEGADLLLYPPPWLDRAAAVALHLQGQKRQARAIGCDPGEGGADSAWAVVDQLGLIDLLSLKTPDTSVIPSTTLALMHRHGVPAERVAIDRGGGGKQHADRLRSLGHAVRTIAFGEEVAMDVARRRRGIDERREAREEAYTYKNRRAQMYGEFRLLLDPAAGVQTLEGLVGGPGGFGLPAEYTTLRRQLAPIPLTYDPEGRLELLPKNRRPGQRATTRKTLVELIGESPDQADAVVLSCHAMLHRSQRAKVRVG